MMNRAVSALCVGLFLRLDAVGALPRNYITPPFASLARVSQVVDDAAVEVATRSPSGDWQAKEDTNITPQDRSRPHFTERMRGVLRGVPIVDKLDESLDANTQEAMGVTKNAVGDFDAFFAALTTNVCIGLACVIAFVIARPLYPFIYSNNVLLGVAPATNERLTTCGEGLFGWARAAWYVTTDDVVESVGLDQAMLLEFTHLCMRILAIAGVPTLCILAPTQAMFGGMSQFISRLSIFSMASIEFGSWLYWIHAFVVWGVVLTVVANIYVSHKDFLTRRYKWLREMPEPQRSTILVEGIPAEYQSDAKLRQFFGQLFTPAKIKSAYVVRQVGGLAAAMTRKKASERNLHEARARCAKYGQDGYQQKVDDHLKDCEDADVAIRNERTAVRAGESEPGGVNTCNGFVTFVERKDARIAQCLHYCEDAEAIRVSVPPAPNAVLWTDLQRDTSDSTVRTLLGYALVFCLYLGFVPIVLGITSIATHIDMGFLQPLWEGLAPSVGLWLMVSYLPTVLHCIFNTFFTLKDSSRSQAKLQNWYFMFQVVFVILVTTIGANVVDLAEMLATDPFGAPALFAETMPYATHFYMNFLVLQWMSTCFEITRAAPFGKFLLFRRFWNEEDARSMAEPEDQDYYGIGSRSARFSINMCIGIVFGTLSPIIYVLTFIDFAIRRLVFGYLMVFAETKKPDLGGVFWANQLDHLYVGVAIYCIVMTGVLQARSATSGPYLISASSILFVIWAYIRVHRSFVWERLPFKELALTAPCSTSRKARQSEPDEYIQPELVS